MSYQCTVVTSILFLLSPAFLMAADQSSISPVSIVNSSQHVIYSEAIDQHFRIDVAMPLGLPFDVIESYPVVYVVDGNALFPMVYSNARAMQGGPEVAPAIFVGIGYDSTDTFEIMALRDRDLTPTLDKPWQYQMASNRLVPLPFQVESGGAEKFIEFIEADVKPLINANYPTNEENETLVGYSFGGLFGLYVLFKHTESFDKYVIGSPSTWWDNNIVFSYEEEYADTHTDLAKSVFLSTGTLESERMRTGAMELYNKLASRGFDGLDVTHLEFEGETHTSGIGVALNRGLKTVYRADTETYLGLLMEIVAEMRSAN